MRQFLTSYERLEGSFRPVLALISAVWGIIGLIGRIIKAGSAVAD
jgi:hypothetical protein